MSFVAIKTPEQMDLLALHRVRSRLVGQRTGVTNQIRGFLLERGITVRQQAHPHSLGGAGPRTHMPAEECLSCGVTWRFRLLAQQVHANHQMRIRQ
jgi:transposase